MNVSAERRFKVEIESNQHILTQHIFWLRIKGQPMEGEIQVSIQVQVLLRAGPNGHSGD